MARPDRLQPKEPKGEIKKRRQETTGAVRRAIARRDAASSETPVLPVPQQNPPASELAFDTPQDRLAARQTLVNLLLQQEDQAGRTSAEYNALQLGVPVRTRRDAVAASFLEQQDIDSLQGAGLLNGCLSPEVIAANQKARQVLVDQLARRTQLLTEADAIRTSVGQTLLAEPPREITPVTPRVTDTEVLKTPLLPERERRQQIAVTWQQRLQNLDSFQSQLANNPRWQQIIEGFVRRKEALTRDLFEDSDPRGDVFVKVSAYLSDEEMRTALLADIDRVTKAETEQIIQRAKRNNKYIVGYPFLVGGTGWHGANAALTLQAVTDAPTLAIDMGERRGGLFRTFTPQSGPDIPSFATNSRDNRRQIFNQRSLAGGIQNLNPFFDGAPVQTVAFDRSSYPGNHIFAAATAVNSYLAGESLQGAKLVNVRRLGFADTCDLLATVTYQGESFLIPFFGGALALGSGDFTIPNPDKETARIIKESKQTLKAYLNGETDTLPQVVTGQEFLQMAVARRGDFFRSLIGKRIALAGKKDTAQIVIAALAGDAPDPRLYGDYVSQEGQPEIVYWIGPEAKDRAALRDELQVRPRYARGGFPDYPREASDVNALLQPTFGTRATSLAKRGDRLIVSLERPGERPATELDEIDLFISCTGVLTDQAAEILSGVTRFQPLRKVVDGRGNQLYKEVPGYEDRLLVVGPAAGLQASDFERAQAPALQKVGENVVAIWLNTEKVVLAARAIARRYNDEKDENIPYPVF